MSGVRDEDALAASRDAQSVASNPETSAFVSANAGAGKTHVLTDRVTRLLLDGNDPARLLCLTYTRAAAAEMKERVFKRLGAWSLMSDKELKGAIKALTGSAARPEDLRRARQLFATAIETPGGLKIQTIHGFCERLIARFPLEAGVAAPFTVIEERGQAELLDRAQQSVFDDAERDPVLAQALGKLPEFYDADAFATLAPQFVSSRGIFRTQGSRTREAFIASCWQALGLEAGATREATLREATLSDPERDATLARVADAMSRYNETDKKTAAAISAFLASHDRTAAFEDYAEYFYTKEGEPRAHSGVVTKKATTAEPWLADALAAERERVHAVRQRLIAIGIVTMTEALIVAGDAIRSAYTQEKRRHAALDYDDLIDAALRLLSTSGAAQWVLYKLDGGIDHILIDEAQDTSRPQWAIVEALAAEFFAGEGRERKSETTRTIFAVGDEKQSIFSFQGASPGEFARMRRAFAERVRGGGAHFADVRLESSFRSAATVLAAVDATFALPEARDGVTAEADAIRHRAVRIGQRGVVEVWPTEKPSDRDEPLPWESPVDQVSPDAPAVRLADKIATHIAAWCGSEMLESRGRPIEPQDILILVRRRSVLTDSLIRLLKEKGVAVAGADRLKLLSHIAVQDLMALGAFALLPQDDLTLGVLLKGPFIGFSEDELYAAAHERTGTLWEALRAAADGQGALDARRAREAVAFLREVMTSADRIPPFDFYARVLGPLGGRRMIVSRLGVEAHDPVDEFLALAESFEREHPPSLQNFLSWLEVGGGEIKRDLDRGGGAVRVMTVHGAKGLEAPVVILPDTLSLPNKNNDPQLVPVGDDAVLWRSGGKLSVLTEARAVLERQQREEYRRLLYVAMTRARDRLYVCGYENLRPAGVPAGSWYDLVARALAPTAERVETEDGTILRLAGEQTKPPDSTTDATADANEAGPAPAWLSQPVADGARRRQAFAPSQIAPDDTPAPSPAGPDAQRRFVRGRIIHRLLQTLPDIEPASRAAAAERFLQREALGLSETDRTEIARSILALIDDSRFAAAFAPGSRAEAPLAGRIPALGDAVISGQIDRLAVTRTRVLVIDYKTNRQPPADAAHVPRAYVAQMAIYRALLAAVFPGRPIDCALLWTESATLMQLENAVLDASITQLATAHAAESRRS